MSMRIHFAAEELAERRAKTCHELAARGLDALLMFRQESMYYLTGYDSFGYVFFQTLVLTADGRLALLTRAPDLRQARFTSVISDVRVWVDRAGAEPVAELKRILVELKLEGKRLGVEYDAYGLTAANGKKLEQGLDGFATLVDASDLVSRLRLVKSAAEIAYVRMAAELADRAWAKAVELAAPGVYEGEILAAMHGEIFKRGGDDPANEFIVGSGPGALMCRYFTGRRHLAPNDQLTLEFAGTWRHYHACLMRTLRVGDPPQRQPHLWAAAQEALLACEATLRPGAPLGAVFDAHARTLDARGLSKCRLNACGYSLGATYAPNWMDWPMLYQGNSLVAAPGMVFFVHIIIFDDDAGLAATLGRTSLVTEQGAEPLSKAGLEFVVK
jgi:Xaa-Pro dipeptidase